MSWQVLTPLLPILAVFLGIGCFIFLAALWQRSLRRHHRESPLAHSLMRPYGYSLRLKIERIDDDIWLATLGIVVAPLLFFSVYVAQSHFGHEPDSLFRVVTTVSLALGSLALASWKLLGLLGIRKNFVLGLEGEMFTGEELNQLMLAGCRVFHDIPFPYGNIDHVVVSPSGVYSVNTKVRGKPKQGPGRAEVTVDYKNGTLRFPDVAIPIPTKQLNSSTAGPVRCLI